jgi:hypothetical protein
MFTQASKAFEIIPENPQIPTNDNLSPTNYNSFNFLAFLPLNLSAK